MALIFNKNTKTFNFSKMNPNLTNKPVVVITSDVTEQLTQTIQPTNQCLIM